MSNPEHLIVVKKGKEAITKWRKQHPRERLKLTWTYLMEVNLSGANLSQADLGGANLTLANLSEANLEQANLSLANLSGVNLTVADLSRANLQQANLTLANLSEANLSQADLWGANLSSADFSGVNLSTARCGYTVFGNCDLSLARGLDLVVHRGPSIIGVDTLIASFRGAGNSVTPELETFLLGAGVPKSLLAELPRILAHIQYCIAFICYGEPDLSFAQRLSQSLKDKGVSCWLYSMDATPGERTWKEIAEQRRKAEKMIVLCSGKSLVRNGALKEIEEQIDEDPDKMVPISLDNLWKEDGFRVMRGSRDLKPFLGERNYADFSDPACYDNSLERLLKGLERQGSWPRSR